MFYKDRHNHVYIANDIPKAMESRARMVALRSGLKAIKARHRQGELNYGGFQVIDPANGNAIIAGTYYELSAEEVMDACEAYSKKRAIQASEPGWPAQTESNRKQ